MSTYFSTSYEVDAVIEKLIHFLKVLAAVVSAHEGLSLLPELSQYLGY